MAFIPPALMGINAALSLGTLLFGRRDSDDELQRFMQRIQSMLSPQNLNAATNQLAQNAFASPAFSSASRSLLRGSNAIQRSFDRANPGAGVTTGVGTTGRALASGALGFGQSQLNSQVFQNASQRALQLLSQQTSLARGLPLRPSVGTGDIFSNLLGPSSQFLLQYLLAQNRLGGGGGGGGGNVTIDQLFPGLGR